MQNRKLLILAGIAIIIWTVFSVITLKHFYENQIGVSFSNADAFVTMDNIVIKGTLTFPLALFLFANILDGIPIRYTVCKVKKTVS